MPLTGRFNRVGALAPPLPAGPFDVIVADPPWCDDFGKSSGRAVERHYSTMKLEEICALPVSAIAEPNAVIFLWTTAPMLEKSLEVLKAWGFDYRTNAVWVKDKIGTGKWLRNRHEQILLGRRGKFRCSSLGDSVIEAPRRRHSEKPEQLQDRIEAAFQGMKYLELFARRERSGWTSWGNEVEGVAA